MRDPSTDERRAAQSEGAVARHRPSEREVALVVMAVVAVGFALIFVGRQWGGLLVSAGLLVNTAALLRRGWRAGGARG